MKDKEIYIQYSDKIKTSVHLVLLCSLMLFCSTSYAKIDPKLIGVWQNTSSGSKYIHEFSKD